MSNYRLILLLTFLSLMRFSAAQNFDITVTDRAVVQRGVVASEARSLSVGMPGGFNFTFDPVRCRIDTVWFGDFLDYRAEATGRGGGKLQILGVTQTVGTDRLPIRVGDAEREPKNIEFTGYKIDPTTGIPTFVFRIDGVEIEQRVLSFGTDLVAIELFFPEGKRPPCYYRLNPELVEAIEVSDTLDMDPRGVIQIPPNTSWAQIQVRLKPTQEKFVRPKPIINGRLLYALHCMSCHTLDGKKKIGPSFTELWKSERLVTRNGVTDNITADEEYIRESILQPQAAIVQGYENANRMIDIRATLNEEQIETLVKFLLDMRPNE